ncbi:hypothetical protein J437_LFUL012477 [Ladona fulva]|uniref:Uncharacterized protein n=1 Tax=Ladona fulva TaxID=123851 RepID=A0A8K0KEM9_LADFU|nr:hypothetical protein J437_LFUL012477 [Ladona fulva]
MTSIEILKIWYSVLFIDGWKSEAANTVNVTAMIHDIASEVGFINAWDISGERETGDALTDIVSPVIFEARDMFNFELYALYSDNTPTMMKMGKIIDLWHITCNSHTASLLAKELISPEFASRVNTVLKAFTSADQEASLLAIGGHRISLACDACWCSNRDAFLCLKKKLPAMKKVLGQGITIENTALKLIFDHNFIIADAAEEWFQLKFPDGYPGQEEKDEEMREYILTIYGLRQTFCTLFIKGRV